MRALGKMCHGLYYYSASRRTTYHDYLPEAILIRTIFSERTDFESRKRTALSFAPFIPTPNELKSCAQTAVSYP